MSVLSTHAENEMEKARKANEELRDRFAIAAMASLASKNYGSKGLAAESYRIADAMMEARQ